MHRGRHLAHLVQKDRAAIGHFEPPLLLRERAGERAALVPKEFRLKQRLCERRAVERDESAPGARAVAMKRTRSKFFARAGFAADEHGRIGRRDARD